MQFRDRIIFTPESRAPGTYYSAPLYVGDLSEGNIYTKVTAVSPGGTLTVSLEATGDENPGGDASADWHPVLTLPTITTTGSQEPVATTNLGRFYRIKAVVATAAVTFGITSIDKIRR